MPTKEVTDFAMRVERMCDFFIDKVSGEIGSDDLAALHDLKDEASRMQDVPSHLFEGLDKYMRGM